jgi:hypothetical protein
MDKGVAERVALKYLVDAADISPGFYLASP